MHAALELRTCKYKHLRCTSMAANVTELGHGCAGAKAQKTDQTDAAAAPHTICRYCAQLHPHVWDLQLAADGGTTTGRKRTAVASGMPPVGGKAATLGKRAPLAPLAHATNAARASDATDQVLLLCFALLCPAAATA
jgi:hypothetical protein